jgi:biopolymer transport protein ExbD
MRFLVRKRRSTPAVIIVALIDVLIVLVIFLLITTTFKQQQQVLRLKVPESRLPEKEGASENPPFVVSIKAGDDKIYYLEKLDKPPLPVTFDQMRSALMSQVAKNPQLTLAINADEKAPWGKIVRVRDAAAEAKIKSLVAYTKETGKP